LTLISEIDESLPMIAADENRIQQILYNLIGNAVKFTEKGTVRVFAQAVNDKVAVSIKDTGIGIPADKFDKIFESFEQADGSTAREYGGTGLGLSITKKLVELHGGTMTLESKIGEGSTFTFTVPKSDAAVTEVTDEAVSRSVIDAAKFLENETEVGFDSAIINPGATRILVVDDEPVNIQVLNNLLSVRNFTVIKAYNGLEAIRLIDKGEEFDLVLLDVMMPKMSGYDVCKYIRNKYSPSDLPIIMLTAKNQVQDIVFGFQAGANDYVQKPFDKDELLIRIKTLLELKEAMHAVTIANTAKTQFLANMSHELRTPLNAVIGLTALLLKTPMNETQRDYTEKMNQASALLLGIINNILDFSNVEAGKMKLERVEFDVRKMLNSLTDDFKRQYADSPVTLNVELDSAVPEMLIGDQLRLRQVFINLIDNGYKFTEKGSISVKGIVMRSDPNNVMMKFSVSDTGIGMDEKQLDVIFAAFNQADNSATRRYGGTGIGLTITREIVELMGGTITVDSRKEQGTTFTFTCPFQVPEGTAVQTAEGEHSGLKPENPDSQNEVLKGLRVLLVEDNRINAMIAAELLRSVGVDVTLATNGQEAINQFAAAVKSRGIPAFDLVLMDLQMPVMDGYEATQIIKNTPEYRDTPIYALTAHAFAEERERCRALGMQEHLTKPVDVEKFYEALRKIAVK
jgi:signal transduction histidine kinase